MQLVVALDGALRVRGHAQEPWLTCGAFLVRPDAAHEVDARCNTVLIGFIDAERGLGAALSEEIDGDIALVDSDRVGRWRAAIGSPITEAGVEQWVNRLPLRPRRGSTIDPRVERVLTHLRSHLGASDDVSLPTLAALANLSPSRFMHVFTESVGVPVRPYIRWLRLQRAACELMDGAGVSSAAHRAGFADAAHLTRTFRRTLGTTPSDIALRARSAKGISVPTEAAEATLPATRP